MTIKQYRMNINLNKRLHHDIKPICSLSSGCPSVNKLNCSGCTLEATVTPCGQRIRPLLAKSEECSEDTEKKSAKMPVSTIPGFLTPLNPGRIHGSRPNRCEKCRGMRHTVYISTSGCIVSPRRECFASVSARIQAFGASVTVKFSLSNHVSNRQNRKLKMRKLR